MLHHQLNQDDRDRVIEGDETLDITDDVSHVLEIATMNGDMPTLQLLLNITELFRKRTHEDVLLIKEYCKERLMTTQSL